MGRLNTSLLPPFGWRFPRDFPVENNQWIEADTPEHLTREVTRFRIENRITVGNPQKEIEDYICLKYPRHCYDQNPVYPVSDEPKNLRERVTSWAANRYESIGTIKFVSTEEARRRADICLTCPKNQEWRVGCPPCVESTERNLVLIRQANSLPNQEKLGGCEICGHDNLTAAFLPAENLNHRCQYETQLPEPCWLKEL